MPVNLWQGNQEYRNGKSPVNSIGKTGYLHWMKP